MEVKISGFSRPVAGPSRVEGIDGQFAANDSPKVATARLSAQSLIPTIVRICYKLHM